MVLPTANKSILFSERLRVAASTAKTIALTLQFRNVTFCVVVPIFAFLWSFQQPLHRKTTILAVVLYVISGIGITAGYHRLWSHRSFAASPPLRVFLALAGACSIQGSILTWTRDHRAHHRYVDTPKDPYNVKKGLLWSHIGWLLFKPDPKLLGHVDVSDLLNDEVVTWQHRNFAAISLSTSYALPAVIAMVGWNDGWGGLLYAGILRAFLFQQSTSCVNSLAHYLGDQPYADTNSPRDHIFTSLLTFGEGYHNFHHEFPSDYRNGVRWFDYDPTKWCIALWAMCGFASNLQGFDANEVNKAIFQQKDKQLQFMKQKIDWGVPPETLPIYTWTEFQDLCDSKGRAEKLVCIAGVIYDVGPFMEIHPGGQNMILTSIGKDATSKFHGGIYNHSKAANNLLHGMRFGVLKHGGKVEEHLNS